MLHLLKTTERVWSNFSRPLVFHVLTCQIMFLLPSAVCITASEIRPVETEKMAEDDPPFKAEYAKSGRAGCKLCKGSISKDSLRLAKMVQVKLTRCCIRPAM